MKWCVECGEVGKPEPAITEIEGDPLCAGHARVCGIGTYGKGVVVESPSAPKESVMGIAVSGELCGCGRAQIHKGRCAYRRNNSGGATPVQRKSAPKRVTVAPQPNELDELWGGLSQALRRKALRSLLEWDGVPNLA